MGVDEINLQVMDVEMIVKISQYTTTVRTYLQVATLAIILSLYCTFVTLQRPAANGKRRGGCRKLGDFRGAVKRVYLFHFAPLIRDFRDNHCCVRTRELFIQWFDHINETEKS